MAGLGRMANRWNSLTTEQKLSVGVLGIASLIAFVFALVQVRMTLIRPFTTDVQTLVDLKEKLGPTDAELAEDQKKTDTDGDGVSDYDELNIYHSSPYVRDSDSDGEPDNIEIAKGTDPNCAKGKTCVSSSTGTEAATGTRAAFEPVIPDYGAFPGGGFGSEPSPVPPRDPDAIRAYLQASGWSAADVASFTDEQILEAYDQSKATLDQPITTTSTTDSSPF